MAAAIRARPTRATEGGSSDDRGRSARMTTPASSITVPTAQGAARWAGAAQSGKVRVEFLVVASVALGAAGQLVLKGSLLLLTSHGLGMNLAGGPQLKCAAGIFFGLCIYAIGTCFWIKAVSRAPI